MPAWIVSLVCLLVGVPVVAGASAMPARYGEALSAHAAGRPAAVSADVLRGADISWPNCPKGMGISSRPTEGQPMPTRSADFVIVGVTNGPGFFPNPCLANQVRWVRNHHRRLAAYAMTTYPRHSQLRSHRSDGPYGATHRHAGLRNAGYAQATFNLATMAAAGMSVPMIWVDVEPYPAAPWTKHRRANRAVIAGAVRAYRDAGLRVGIYTYANGWAQVVGAWRLPGLPTWSTVGDDGAGHALRSCTRGPSGGRTWIVQWWRGHRDKDLRCPAAPRRTSRLFATSPRA